VVGGAVVTAGALVVAGARGANVVGAALGAGTADGPLPAGASVTAELVVGASVPRVVATSAPVVPDVVSVRVLVALLPQAAAISTNPMTTRATDPRPGRRADFGLSTCRDFAISFPLLADVLPEIRTTAGFGLGAAEP
jgi:hypothetical protein